MTGLDGKVAICTGSGRHNGLGQHILKHLAAEGCRVVVSDIGVPKKHLGKGDIGVSTEMEEIATEIRDAGEIIV